MAAKLRTVPVGFLALAVLAALAALAAGCGGKSDADDGNGNVASCAFEACGGDLLGTWDVVELCPTLALDGTPTACQDNMALGDASASGWMQFDASEVTTSLDVRYTISWKFDSECTSALTNQSIPIDEAFCSAFEQELLTTSAAQSVTCPYANGACYCSFGFVNTGGGTNPYAVSGTSILSADGHVVPYCVKDEQLWLQDRSDLASVAYVLQRR